MMGLEDVETESIELTQGGPFFKVLDKMTWYFCLHSVHIFGLGKQCFKKKVKL